MLRVRVSVVVFAAALVAVGWSLGDDKKDAPKARGQLPANWKKLGLTDEQTQKVYKIQADFGVKINDLKEQIKKLEDEMRVERLKVLTDDQKKRLKEIATGDLDKPEEKKKTTKPSEEKK